VRASHDGYLERFGILHHRVLSISADGNKIDGEDLFMPPEDELEPKSTLDEFATRFHLHPGIKANRLTDGRGVMLILPNKDVWNFTAHEDRVELEESVYLGGLDGPRRTLQIVISGQARKVGRVHWTFAHVPHGALTNRRSQSEELELPL